MSTSFDTSFDVDDIIEASHVSQFATPINDLEDAFDATTAKLGSNAFSATPSASGSVGVGADAGRYQTGADNTFVGSESGLGVSGSTTGNKNTGIGGEALKSVTTGGQNVAVGFQALKSLTTANNLCGIGYLALGDANNTTIASTAIGAYAGEHHVGDYNTFGGYAAGESVAGSGDYNTAWGARSLNALTTGGTNTGIGAFALEDLTTGSSNTALGYISMRNLTTGINNVAIGRGAGHSLTSGQKNVFLGFHAGYNETGDEQLYIHNSGVATPLIHGEFDNKNVGFNSKEYEDGEGVIAIGNVVTEPTTNPTGAGILYVKSNKLWFMPSSGSLKEIKFV